VAVVDDPAADLFPNCSPDWGPVCPPSTSNRLISQHFLVSGRQDLNLRPPGPQPERCSNGRCSGPVFTGLRCA
jgi:hypothetical protein